MDKIYVGYFLDHNGIVLYDYVGWSKSEYITSQFLKQFNVDQNIYYPNVIEKDESDDVSDMTDMGVDIVYDTEIVRHTTTVHDVLITSRIWINWEDEVGSEDGPLRTWFVDAYGEEAMYNRLFAILDQELLRPSKQTPILKELIKLMYSCYKTNYLDPYMENIDHVEMMIRMGYMDPLAKKKEEQKI